jgi:Pep3/Vps18/deep orange beta-propeller domain
MFELERVDYTPPHRVIGLQVCNGIIAMGLENGNIIRLDISRPHELEGMHNQTCAAHTPQHPHSLCTPGFLRLCMVPHLTPSHCCCLDIRPMKKTERIHNLFLCPRGKHLIVSMTSGDNYYLHTDAPKPPRPKLLTRFKGVLISAIAWDKQNSDSSTTRRILIGTQQGIIHEAQISGLGREVALTPPLHRLSETTNPQPITGLAFERCAGTTHQFLIMATIAANQGTAEEGTIFHHVRVALYCAAGLFLLLASALV